MRRHKTLIFDLDGTLYDTKGMDKQNREAAIDSIASLRGISVTAARIVLDTELKGSSESISAALRKLGVCDEDFERRQMAIVRPEDSVGLDPELVGLLRAVKLRYQTILFTNTRRELAVRALVALGMGVGDFDYIFAGGDLSEPKPSVFALKEILARVGALPDDAFTIGDRWKVDNEPGVVLGIHPIKVGGRDDLVHWLREAIAKNG